MRPEIEAAAANFATAKSMGDVMTLLSLAQTEDEATALRSAYVASIPSAKAEGIADSNIGYMTGYYGREEAERLCRIYRVRHPIFGLAHADGSMTPERALALGKQLASERP